MNEAPDDDAPVPLSGPVRALQWLVIGLTASMMVGVIAVVAVVVTRFPKPPTPPMPDSLMLPAGARAVAVTQGTDWIAVVTDDDRILVFSRATGALRQTVRLETP